MRYTRSSMNLGFFGIGESWYSFVVLLFVFCAVWTLYETAIEEERRMLTAYFRSPSLAHCPRPYTSRNHAFSRARIIAISRIEKAWLREATAPRPPGGATGSVTCPACPPKFVVSPCSAEIDVQRASRCLMESEVSYTISDVHHARGSPFFTADRSGQHGYTAGVTLAFPISLPPSRHSANPKCGCIHEGVNRLPRTIISARKVPKAFLARQLART